jgi:hypothetical protein
MRAGTCVLARRKAGVGASGAMARLSVAFRSIKRREFERIAKRKFDAKAVNTCNYFFGPRDGSRTDKFNKFVEERMID